MVKKLRLAGLGQRDETVLLLTVGLFLLAFLSTFTLVSYRRTVDQLIEERQQEAAQLARVLAARIGSGPLPTSNELAALAPSARGLAILDRSGRSLWTAGDISFGDLPGTSVVAGQASLRGRHAGLRIKVELNAGLLLVRKSSLRVLTWVVSGSSLAVVLLLAVFLRRWLAPWHALLERVRAVRGGIPETRDIPDSEEVALLVDTLERALEVLRQPREPDELEALGRTFVGSLESGVLLCSQDGSVLALNANGAELLGIGVPSPKTPLDEVFASHPLLLRVLQAAIDGRQAIRRQEVALGDETGRTFGLTVHPLRRDGGEIRGFLALFVDLTAEQREEDTKRLSERLDRVGELAAGVAHEMRNSLATLRGYLDLTLRDPEDPDSATYLGEMRRESDHLKRVLEDFLTFARPGSTRLESVDLRRLAHRAAADPALGGVPIRVEVMADPAADVLVQGDPQLLARAFYNLLSNAAEAQANGDTQEPILLRLDVEGGQVRVAVEDRGPGLPAGAAEELFEPFVSERPGGVGLGLALTRRIVLLHGGQVGIEARRKGGVRAELTLPLGKNVTQGND